MQAMMKQAQALQRDMLKTKEEIDSTEFTSENEFVKVILMGDKTISSIKILKRDSFEEDDFDILEDMIILAINDAISKIDKETERKMGKFGNIPGLF